MPRYPFDIRTTVRGTTYGVTILSDSDLKVRARSIGGVSPGYVQTCDPKDPEDFTALVRIIERGLARGK